MSLSKALLAELGFESESTRKILLRIPDEQLGWRPHEKSMSLVQLARHIAWLPTWIKMAITQTEHDLSTGFVLPEIKTTGDVVALFEEKITEAKKLLEGVSDETLNEIWTLRKGDTVMFQLPKKAVIRSVSFNHSYHHRGQLTVYLRLLGVPLPNIYGPTADEQ
ncbi:MAG: DinB family protein [Filimonas sp.]|nr:DinB family protein [Filimonas sp.]